MGVARQFLADPEWVKKLMNEQIEDIRPCICCHNACFTMCHYEGSANDQELQDATHMARCAINPITMQTTKYKIVNTKKALNVAVIGGGIGGMEAARVLTLRGHHVTIYEKSNRLGGIFNEAAACSFKEKDRQLLSWYKHEMEKLHIKIKFNTEVADLSSLTENKIIVAIGAKAR